MLTDTTYEVVITQESHYRLPADVLEKNSAEDITHSSSTQETTVE